MIVKSLLRIGAIAGVVTAATVGGTVLIAGPQRSAALFDKARDQVIDHIDTAIDDPAALRSQLRELEGQYPERITALRGDLAELQEQIRRLERDKAISERVVSLAQNDLDTLEPKLAQLRSSAADNDFALAAATITLENRIYTVKQAMSRANQIQQTQIAYSNRAADAGHDLLYLEKQAGRMEEMLLQLETERAQFQTQLSQLERQVDAIARNERLIEMMEDRQKTLDECSRYEAASLEQIVSSLAETRSRQEATLEYLSGQEDRSDYEQVARMQLEAMGEVADQGLEIQTADSVTLQRIR